jgi:hypothetical protein
MNLKHILILSLSLNLSVLANDTCGAIYTSKFSTVHGVAAAILAGANGSRAAAIALIQSPLFANMIIAGKRADPNFMKKLKDLLNGNAKSIPGTESMEETFQRLSLQNKPPVDYGNQFEARSNIAQKIPLRRGEFSKKELSESLGYYMVELADGDILSLPEGNPNIPQEIKRLAPILDGMGDIRYNEIDKISATFISVSKPKLVNSDLVAVMTLDSSGHKQLTILNPNNLDPNTFTHIDLRKYRNQTEVVPISTQHFVVIDKSGGPFIILDRTTGAISKEYDYAPSTPAPNITSSVSELLVLPDRDLLVAFELGPRLLEGAQDPYIQLSVIQHWVRQSDGTYQPGRVFDTGTYTYPDRMSYMTGSFVPRINGMKMLPGGILVTAEYRGLVKTWKWDNGNLSLLATENIKNAGNVWIKSLEVLADGQILVNTMRGDETLPLYRIDSSGKISATTRIPTVARGEGPGAFILPLQHGGFYTAGIKNYWLWTRKP